MVGVLAALTLPLFFFFGPLLRLVGADLELAEQAGLFARVVWPGVALKMQAELAQEFMKVQ